MAGNVAQKLIESHLVDGEMNIAQEIALRIDQTLTQDATGTLVMLVIDAGGSGGGALSAQPGAAAALPAVAGRQGLRLRR